MLREPSVSWLPYLASSPGAWTIRTFAQSAPISSATIIGRPVRTPVPISERCATMVTMPSGATETKTRGSVTTPCGMAPAPVLYAASARRGSTDAASTRPPVAATPLSSPRRLTFSTGPRAALRGVPGVRSWK